MSRFKLGQKVVAVKDQSDGVFKKGQIFTVYGFACCRNCGKECIELHELSEVCLMYCAPNGCGFVNVGVRERYSEILFAPIQNNADAIEYRLNVSIPELTEIKEVQHQ